MSDRLEPALFLPVFLFDMVCSVSLGISQVSAFLFMQYVLLRAEHDPSHEWQ